MDTQSDGRIPGHILLADASVARSNSIAAVALAYRYGLRIMVSVVIFTAVLNFSSLLGTP